MTDNRETAWRDAHEARRLWEAHQMRRMNGIVTPPPADYVLDAPRKAARGWATPFVAGVLLGLAISAVLI